jgi:glucose/arabinose dehydrogenase
MWRAAMVAGLIAGIWMIGCGDDDGSAKEQAPIARAAAVKLAKVGTFDDPLYVAATPKDKRRIYVVEQGGRIRVVRDGHKLGKSFLDIRAKVLANGEQGLLGLAFPDSSRTGRFYVYYTGKDGRQRLVEYRRSSPDRAKASSARTVFVHEDPEGNHNGGQLQFGPDGLLYIGTGDGGGGDDQHGSRGNAQSLASPLGKILRINPKAAKGFKIPSSNPFVNRAGALKEIYSYGLRNPWRFSFDRKTGDLVIGDVGQDAVEEIDFVRKGGGLGANFGWRPFEGNSKNFNEPAPGHVAPVITHTHGEGWCSITGGYVVRDPKLPELAGRYVYGDFCVGRIYGATLSPGGASDVRSLGLPVVSNLSSFGEDAAGRIYVISLSGSVYRLSAG